MFELWVFLHLVSVVVGIGGVMLNGVYAAKSQARQGAEGLAISQANFDVSAIAEKFIYAIPIFGILAVLASDEVYEFDQTWVWLSTLLYLVAVALSHMILIPGHRQLNELAAKMGSGQGGAADVEKMQQLGKRMAPTGAVLNILAVVIIGLMVWKPGF